MIGILGGTFDPVHLAHLRVALEVQEALGLAEVRFVPCRVPPHRATPVATVEQRCAMLRLAIAGQQGFLVDERELQRPGPSYTVDTLAELRAEWPTTPLCLIVGSDAFEGIATWHRWQQLPELAHLVVAHRPGWVPAIPAGAAPLSAARCDAAAIATAPAGGVLFQPVTQLDIAATQIRTLVQAGRSVRYLVPDAVRGFIYDHHLYCEGQTLGG